MPSHQHTNVHTHLPPQVEEVRVEVIVRHDVCQVLGVGDFPSVALPLLLVQVQEDLLSAQHEGQLLPHQAGKRGREGESEREGRMMGCEKRWVWIQAMETKGTKSWCMKLNILQTRVTAFITYIAMAIYPTPLPGYNTKASPRCTFANK